MRCPSCNHDNSTDTLFCDACGAKLELVCATCSTTNQPGARFCKKCGTRIAKESAPAKSAVASTAPKVRVTAEQAVADSGALEGERKTVTALFADIKGSTELMENLDPEEARAIVDPALKLMIDAARRYDGYIVQSTGDGIFALSELRSHTRIIRSVRCIRRSGCRTSCAATQQSCAKPGTFRSKPASA